MSAINSSCNWYLNKLSPPAYVSRKVRQQKPGAGEGEEQGVLLEREAGLEATHQAIFINAGNNKNSKTQTVEGCLFEKAGIIKRFSANRKVL